MGRRSTIRALDVWMNGERVGRWTLSRGEHLFEYSPDWLSSPFRRPVSLSMPLRAPGAEPYRTAVVQPFFENLLPDSDEIRRRVMNRFGTRSTGAFDLLEQIGRDCVGAVQLLPADSARPDVRKIRGHPLSDADVATLLARVRSPSMGAHDEDDFRISLAGAQEKTALLWHKDRWWIPAGTTPSTHIFKLPLMSADPSAPDLSASVENEWLCAQILLQFGIRCARSEMRTFGDQRVLVVERFDRRLSPDRSWIIRRPQEDFCQILGVPPGQKYESQGGPGIGQILETLLGSSDALADREDFFRTQFVFWLLCAIDGHAKNFSVFIEPEGRFFLTPRYDVLSAYPVLGRRQNQLSPHRVKMAMAVSSRNKHYGWKEIRVEHWLETARRYGLPKSGRPVLEEVLERTPTVIESVRSLLPRSFPGSVGRPILDGCANTAARAREALAGA